MLTIWQGSGIGMARHRDHAELRRALDNTQSAIGADGEVCDQALLAGEARVADVAREALVGVDGGVATQIVRAPEAHQALMAAVRPVAKVSFDWCELWCILLLVHGADMGAQAPVPGKQLLADRARYRFLNLHRTRTLHLLGRIGRRICSWQRISSFG